MHLEIFEGLDSVSLHGLGSRLSFEDTGFFREGVDAVSSFGSGLLLDNEASHTRDDKLAALLELRGT